MSSKLLPISFLRCLLRLSQGEELKASEIASKKLLRQFVADGLIKEKAISKQRRTYVCHDAQGLLNYLNAQYDIISLEHYLQQKESGETDGERSLNATKSTKVLRKKSLQGFFIKAYGASLAMGDKELPVTPDGVDLFVHQPKALKVNPEVLIVGIENPECFVKFSQLRHLFPQKPLLLVMRYMSKSPNKWLESIPNNYLHFGDFDPAGISIYINEYRNRLGLSRCGFFIPDPMDVLMEQYGSTQLYDAQQHLLKNIDVQDDAELKILIQLMQKHHKGVEQERLLSVI